MKCIPLFFYNYPNCLVFLFVANIPLMPFVLGYCFHILLYFFLHSIIFFFVFLLSFILFFMRLIYPFCFFFAVYIFNFLMNMIHMLFQRLSRYAHSKFTQACRCFCLSFFSTLYQVFVVFCHILSLSYFALLISLSLEFL